MGCYGCKIPDLTPNIDRLAAEGMRFQYAYATVAVCQPVREMMHCGRYPHRSGAMGFSPLKPEVRTLNQQLRDAGYLISMIGKNGHYLPTKSFPVDYTEPKINRSPGLAEATMKFIGMARPGEAVLPSRELRRSASSAHRRQRPRRSRGRRCAESLHQAGGSPEVPGFLEDLARGAPRDGAILHQRAQAG